jgi:hypothetical protein
MINWFCSASKLISHLLSSCTQISRSWCFVGCCGEKRFVKVNNPFVFLFDGDVHLYRKLLFTQEFSDAFFCFREALKTCLAMRVPRHAWFVASNSLQINSCDTCLLCIIIFRSSQLSWYHLILGYISLFSVPLPNFKQSWPLRFWRVLTWRHYERSGDIVVHKSIVVDPREPFKKRVVLVMPTNMEPRQKKNV